MTFKIMWGITGTGYLLDESLTLMKELQSDYDVDLTVILSKEGATVVKWYKKWLQLTEIVENLFQDQNISQIIVSTIDGS
ncbi:MAG: hypothetical protein ACFFD5_14135, partial [Candidatus Thorarchaeota archaeon]